MTVSFTSRYLHLSEEWSLRRSTGNSLHTQGCNLYCTCHIGTQAGGHKCILLRTFRMASHQLWHTANKIPRFSTTAPIALFATKTFSDRLSWLTVTARACVCVCVCVYVGMYVFHYYVYETFFSVEELETNLMSLVMFITLNIFSTYFEH